MPVSPAVISHLMRMRHIDEEIEKERKKKKKKNPHRKDSLLEKREIKKEEIDDPNIDSEGIIRLLNKTINETEHPENSIPISDVIRIYEKENLKLENLINKYQKLFSKLLNADSVSLCCNTSKNKISIRVYKEFEYADYVIYIENNIPSRREITGNDELVNIFCIPSNDILNFYNLFKQTEKRAFNRMIGRFIIYVNPVLKYSSIREFGFNEFALLKSYYKEPRIECNSLAVRKEFLNREKQVFDSIYIPIAWCPSFVVEELRKEQEQKGTALCKGKKSK